MQSTKNQTGFFLSRDSNKFILNLFPCVEIPNDFQKENQKELVIFRTILKKYIYKVNYISNSMRNLEVDSHR